MVAFLALLIQKEVLSAFTGGWQRSLARGLHIGLVPLGLAFGMIAWAQVASVFQ